MTRVLTNLCGGHCSGLHSVACRRFHVSHDTRSLRGNGTKHGSKQVAAPALHRYRLFTFISRSKRRRRALSYLTRYGPQEQDGIGALSEAGPRFSPATALCREHNQFPTYLEISEGSPSDLSDSARWLCRASTWNIHFPLSCSTIL
jgi:hypothetical protein